MSYLRDFVRLETIVEVLVGNSVVVDYPWVKFDDLSLVQAFVTTRGRIFVHEIMKLQGFEYLEPFEVLRLQNQLECITDECYVRGWYIDPESGWLASKLIVC